MGFAVGGIAVIRLAVILTLLTAITAQAWTQEMLMRRAYGVRGASVPPTWTPPDSANLLIWFDGFTQAEIDAGVLLDRSGNGYNATQTNATKRGTIVDTNSIKGNGTSSSWAFPNVGTVSNFTVVAIVKPSKLANKQFVSLSDYALANYDIIRFGFSVDGAAECLLMHDTASVATPAVAIIANTNTYYCAAMAYSINNSFAWVNGSIGTPDTSCSFVITNSAPSYSTFLSYGVTYYSDSTIKALLFYRSTLTTNQLSEIQAHYGL
jgi:hypothetical protein